MTWLFLALLYILTVLYFLRREHQDRKAMTPILTLIPGDRFAPPISKDVSKSWWEQIWAAVKMMLLVGAVFGAGFMCRLVVME